MVRILTRYEIEKLKEICRWEMTFWDTYEAITKEENHDIAVERFVYMENGLLDWIAKNTTQRVYYDGDLKFAFESKEERDQFYDECCGDPIAAKLRWTGPTDD